MESIKEMYKIGNGPSSSHTMGPAKASRIFKERNPDAASFHVILYGSLAATGKGHLTDKAIIDSFAPVPRRIACDAKGQFILNNGKDLPGSSPAPATGFCLRIGSF